MEHLHKQECVIFDVETTGLSPLDGDRIIELAALKIKGERVVERFHTLIDPEREISMGAFLVNGISAEMLRGAPCAREVLPKFMSFLGEEGEAWIVGHNIRFDLGFLSRELALINRKLHESVMALDTLRMARKLLPDLSSHRLWVVARSLGIDCDQRHRAMADVEMTHAVFVKLLDLAKSHKIESLEHFICR
jgi:DNA polymerase III epsilon subunit family exonuclease